MLDRLRRRDVDIAYSSVAKTPWGLTFTATRPLGIVLASPIGTNLPATVTFKSLDKLPMICPSPTEERRRLLDEPCERASAILNCVIERSEEHTSELQSLMRISYAVFCLKKKKHNTK